MTSSITSLKKDKSSIKFKINNKKENYEVALINGLRRVILVNLDVFCFSRESVYFQKNTSIYNEDFMSQRLSLIPLNAKEFLKLDLNKLEAHIYALNTNMIEPKPYYAKDIILYYGDIDQPIQERKVLDINKYITIPDILLANIKPDQEMKCIFRVKKGNHKEDGGMFCPVSKCVFFFENDEKEYLIHLNKKDTVPILRDQIYMKTKKNMPLIYNFEIDTDGILEIKELFSLGCDYLINLLKSKIEEIKNIEASKIVSIESSPTNMRGYDFLFENCDDTLGNIIQTYGLKDKEIHYIGYHIPHPLDKRLYIRLALVNSEAKRELYEKKVIHIIQDVIKIIDELKSDYLKSLGDS